MNSVWKDKKKYPYLLGLSKEAFLGDNLLAGIFDKGINLNKGESFKYIDDVYLRKVLDRRYLGLSTFEILWEHFDREKFRQLRRSGYLSTQMTCSNMKNYLEVSFRRTHGESTEEGYMQAFTWQTLKIGTLGVVTFVLVYRGVHL